MRQQVADLRSGVTPAPSPATVARGPERLLEARARRQQGPGRTVQIVVTAFAVLSILGLTFDLWYLSSEFPEAVLPVWWSSAILLAGYACLGLAAWWPLAAPGIALAPLGLILTDDGVGMDPLAILLTLIAAVVITRGWLGWIQLVAFAAWAVHYGLLLPDAVLGLVYGLILCVSTLIGLAIRHFDVERSVTRRELEELERQNRLIRTDERELLARELHDVVAHELSIITLQVMAHGDSDEPEELRAALERVDQASRTALTELRGLVGILRDVTPNEAPPPMLTEVGVHPIEHTAQRVADELRSEGFSPHLEIDAGTVRLSAAQQNTVSRVLQEASTNILRYAEPDSACTFSLSAQPDQLIVQVTSVRSRTREARLSWQSSGWGLKGLRERVRLSGGHLEAHPVGDTWVLTVTLPADPTR